jgi:HSP20 family protein
MEVLMPLVPFRSNLAAKQAYDPFQGFRDEFDRLLDNFLPGLPAAGAREDNGLVSFRVDVSETDKEIQVKAELPGVDEKDIDVQLNRDMLTIRGEKKAEREEKEQNYHLLECSYGSFARSVRLPFEPKSEDVSAKFRNGVLQLTVAKPEKAAQAQRIEIKSE